MSWEQAAARGVRWSELGVRWSEGSELEQAGVRGASWSEGSKLEQAGSELE